MENAYSSLSEKSRLENRAEAEKAYRSRIVLSVFRHGEKEKLPPAGKTGDDEVLLTPAGRKGAIKSGEMFRLPEEGMAQAVAIGSPRKRAQETAAFVMAGEEEMITGDESIDKLKEKIDRGLKMGSKIGASEQLNFSGGSGEFEKEIMGAFKAGKLIDWLVEESDAAAEKYHDKNGSTYSREARDIAELIQRYVRASRRFDDLVQTKKYADTMQRFLGTHQSVGESFLAKVIEKTKGVKERDAFLKAMGSTGFGFVEGFQIEIATPSKGEDRQITLTYRRPAKDGKDGYEFQSQLSKELLEEIVKEGEALEQRVNA